MFVPVALWTPDGWGDGVPPEPLSRYADGLADEDAFWVRARLPAALGFAPPTCRQPVRRRFFDAALLAVTPRVAGTRATPFVCCDTELRAELRFGPHCPADRRKTIAAAFWGLLASRPADLATYRDCFDAGDYVGPMVAGYWQGRFHEWTCRWRSGCVA